MERAATAGQLRFKIRFDKRTDFEGDGGATVSGWSEMGTGSFIRSADIRPMRGGEGVQAQRLVGQNPALLIVRRDMNTKNLDASWRAVELLNGTPAKYFGIRSAQDMERQNQFITVLAVEGDPDGGDDVSPQP